MLWEKESVFFAGSCFFRKNGKKLFCSRLCRVSYRRKQEIEAGFKSLRYLSSNCIFIERGLYIVIQVVEYPSGITNELLKLRIYDEKP